jgi:hypothetical protein
MNSINSISTTTAKKPNKLYIDDPVIWFPLDTQNIYMNNNGSSGNINNLTIGTSSYMVESPSPSGAHYCLAWTNSNPASKINNTISFPTPNYTICVWGKATNFTSSTPGPMLFSLGNIGFEYYNYGVLTCKSSDASYQYYIYNYGGPKVRSDNNTLYQDNKWHHYGFVYANGLISIYIDGIYEGCYNDGGNFGNNFTNVTAFIGSNLTRSENKVVHYAGYRLYDHTLNKLDINYLFVNKM